MNNIKDLIPDDKNMNRGTTLGKRLLDKSLTKFGPARSILVDSKNRIIAGNKTFESYGELGGQDVQIVESDGKRLIAVKRTDIDLDSKEGRELALADNRTSEVGLEWDLDLAELELGKETLLEWDMELPKEDSDKELENKTFWRVYVDCEDEAMQNKIWNQLQDIGIEAKLETK